MKKYASCSKILEDTRILESGYASSLFSKGLRVPTFKIRISKLEARNKSQIRNPNDLSAVLSLKNLGFGIVSDFPPQGLADPSSDFWRTKFELRILIVFPSERIVLAKKLKVIAVLPIKEHH